MAVEPARFRRLRQRHQQRGLRQRQPLRLLAEIGNRRRTDTLEIAAEWREFEIEVEDLVLGELLLELERAHRLADLGGHRPLLPRLQQSSELHGDGGAAGHDLAAPDELQRGAAERQRIDAVMLLEALVLVGLQQIEIGRIDGSLSVDRQPPAAVGHRISAQQSAVAVDDGGRNLFGLRERQRAEGVHPGGGYYADNDDDCRSDRCRFDETPPSAPVMAGVMPTIHDLTRCRGWPGQARP